MLIDEIRATMGQPARPWPPVLNHAVAFAVDNVASYVHDHNTQGEPLDLAGSIPNVAPLAPIAWFEWTVADAPGSTIDGRRAGILLITMLDRTAPATLAAATHVAGGPELLARFPAAARWCLHGLVCWHDRDSGDLIQQTDYAEFFVCEDGRIGEVRIAGPPDLPPTPESVANVIFSYCAVALTATCFAHCRGVQIVDHQAPRQQRRAAQRDGRPPLLSYKTVDIAPVTRILREQGQIEKTGLRRALHFCRGNFAHYAPGHYFGRNPEPVTVFRPLHMRGSLDAGLALKDYRVLPESETAP